MSRNFDLSSSIFNIINQFRNNELNFESRVLITSSTTFVVPTNVKAIKFSAVGGGTTASSTISGSGGGYFEKTFYAPFTGLTTSFQLTVGARAGNTVLADSAGTVIATAYGATEISPSAPVGIGGTAEGGDINSKGSPGGSSPGVGGASGGVYGDSVYDPTYAGRWVYFKESLSNDNIKNFLLMQSAMNGGSNISIASTQGSTGVFAGGSGSTPNIYGAPGGVFSPGGDGGDVIASGAGGYGGNGGLGRGVTGGPGGIGGDGGSGGSGPSSPLGIQPGSAGGPGGFGGNGGPGGVQFAPPTYGGPSGRNGGAGGFAGSGGDGSSASGAGGRGGPGGFGGGGGKSGSADGNNTGQPGGPGGYGGGGGLSGPGPYGQGTPGSGGTGAIIVEWTTTIPNKTGV